MLRPNIAYSGLALWFHLVFTINSLKKCVSEGFAKCTSSEVEETIKVVPGVVYCGKITLPILITGLYIASEFCLSCQVLCS